MNQRSVRLFDFREKRMIVSNGWKAAFEYGRVTQDSYVSELFALNDNVLIHSNYF